MNGWNSAIVESPMLNLVLRFVRMMDPALELTGTRGLILDFVECLPLGQWNANKIGANPSIRVLGELLIKNQ